MFIIRKLYNQITTSTTDLEDIVEMDSLAWKVAQKYLDKSHPCNQFLVKAFEGRGTLDSEAVQKGVNEAK